MESQKKIGSKTRRITHEETIAAWRRLTVKLFAWMVGVLQMTISRTCAGYTRAPYGVRFSGSFERRVTSAWLISPSLPQKES